MGGEIPLNCLSIRNEFHITLIAVFFTYIIWFLSDDMIICETKGNNEWISLFHFHLQGCHWQMHIFIRCKLVLSG